jgi:hypothetical protein
VTAVHTACIAFATGQTSFLAENYVVTASVALYSLMPPDRALSLVFPRLPATHAANRLQGHRHHI